MFQLEPRTTERIKYQTRQKIFDLVRSQSLDIQQKSQAFAIEEPLKLNKNKNKKKYFDIDDQMRWDKIYCPSELVKTNIKNIFIFKFLFLYA